MKTICNFFSGDAFTGSDTRVPDISAFDVSDCFFSLHLLVVLSNFLFLLESVEVILYVSGTLSSSFSLCAYSCW